MFFVNYASDGKIVSYSGAPDGSLHECPADCETLVFAAEIPGFINSNGACMMKVDVEKKELVLINPQVIPKPIA